MEIDIVFTGFCYHYVLRIGGLGTGKQHIHLLMLDIFCTIVHFAFLYGQNQSSTPCQNGILDHECDTGARSSSW
ncbi:unnamed protein product [Citrullus colocynthis]|uniref:Uncharacterized protein n=1 Tax=Citrullus colocynthis TaxID=252529 RepID=A0ABP0YCD3_9ROSI